MAELGGLPVPRRYWSAGAIWLALIMAVLDGAIANVAPPTMARELSAAPDQTVWVANGFQLAVVVSLPPLAAMGEMIGYRRVFLANVALFTTASLACALAAHSRQGGKSRLRPRMTPREFGCESRELRP